MRPSGIEGSYSKAARQLLEATDKHSARQVIDELRQQLTTRLPDRETFKTRFYKLKFSRNYTTHKKLIQYIFSHIETVNQTTHEFKPDSMTLEHILSQSSGTEDFVSAIGNLLPLGAELNEQAGNKTLDKKIEVYKKSDFVLTKEFAQSNPQQWNEEKIQDRTNELAERCYDYMWPPHE
ncbi:MAG: HNH endonuclease family protein [Cyanobacteriota bacterium]|nr:HNH endonuclease family protein [Cyanobacteriota bacterium]